MTTWVETTKIDAFLIGVHVLSPALSPSAMVCFVCCQTYMDSPPRRSKTLPWERKRHYYGQLPVHCHPDNNTHDPRDLHSDWLHVQHLQHWTTITKEVCLGLPGLPQSVGEIVAEFYLAKPGHRYHKRHTQLMFHNLCLTPTTDDLRSYVYAMTPWLSQNDGWMDTLFYSGWHIMQWIKWERKVTGMYSRLRPGRPGSLRAKTKLRMMREEYSCIEYALTEISDIIFAGTCDLVPLPPNRLWTTMNCDGVLTSPKYFYHVPLRVLLCDWLVSLESTVQHGGIDELWLLLVSRAGSWPGDVD